MPRLTLHQITKEYEEFRALRGISLQLEEGLTVLLGSNGAGKSTLLGVLSTRLRPTSGFFEFEGFSSQKEPDEIRRRVGLVGHESFLYLGLTVRENLLLYARLYHLPYPQERIEELAAELSLSSRLETPVGQLSRGLQQRASLLRAFLHDPALLLLDEPFTGLDPGAAEQLVLLLQRWREEGRLLLITTHDLERADLLADRLLFLRQGRLCFDQPWQPQGMTTLRQLYLLQQGNPRKIL